MRRKDNSIETLRGVAILLLVAAHVIGFDSSSGLRVHDKSFYRYFYFMFEYFRMPLFTIISGFVYSMRPALEGNYLGIMKGKAKRLLIPFVVLSTLQFFPHTLPGVNSPKDIADIWTVYFYAIDQFWFLQAIFLVFATALLRNLEIVK